MNEKELLEAMDNRFGKMETSLKSLTEHLTRLEQNSDSQAKMAEEAVRTKELEAKVSTLTAELAESKKVARLAEATGEEFQAEFAERIPDYDSFMELGKSLKYIEKVEPVDEAKEPEPTIPEPVPVSIAALKEASDKAVKPGREFLDRLGIKEAS